MISILSIATIAVAVLLSYYALVGTQVDVGDFLYLNNESAKELEITRTIDGTPGQNYSYYHWLNLSADATGNLTVRFDWTLPDGINGDILHNDQVTTILELQPGDSFYIEERISLDALLTPGSYSVTWKIMPHNYGY